MFKGRLAAGDCSTRSTSMSQTLPSGLGLVLGLGLGLALLLWVGRMCQKVDHLNINLPTHLTIPPLICQQSLSCGSRPCIGQLSTTFDLMGIDAAQST